MADGGDLGEHARGIVLHRRQLELVDRLVHVDDRGVHPRDHPLDQRGDEAAGIARAVPGVEVAHQLARGLHRMAAQREHPRPVGPHLDRDHVLRLGAGIEVHAPQGGDQGLPFAERARAAVVAGQHLGGWLGNAVLFEPRLHVGQRAVEMQPQHFVAQAVMPVLRGFPADRDRAALAVEHAAEQQGSFGFQGVAGTDRRVHVSSMPERTTFSNGRWRRRAIANGRPPTHRAHPTIRPAAGPIAQR